MSFWTRLRLWRGFCLCCPNKRGQDDTYCDVHLAHLGGRRAKWSNVIGMDMDGVDQP